MYAREVLSKQELEKFSRREVVTTPDVANMIPYTKTEDLSAIGFAVSSQIVRKWNATESYVDCIVGLIKHIRNKYDTKVIIYPNEIHTGNPYNDYHLAVEIASFFEKDDSVTIFDSRNRTHIEQRNSIASCQVFFQADTTVVLLHFQQVFQLLLLAGIINTMN